MTFRPVPVVIEYIFESLSLVLRCTSSNVYRPWFKSLTFSTSLGWSSMITRSTYVLELCRQFLCVVWSPSFRICYDHQDILLFKVEVVYVAPYVLSQAPCWSVPRSPPCPASWPAWRTDTGDSQRTWGVEPLRTP